MSKFAFAKSKYEAMQKQTRNKNDDRINSGMCWGYSLWPNQVECDVINGWNLLPLIFLEEGQDEAAIDGIDIKFSSGNLVCCHLVDSQLFFPTVNPDDLTQDRTRQETLLTAAEWGEVA